MRIIKDSWLFQVMHENHLTHTDLKPENILFVNSDFETIFNSKKVRLVGELAPFF